MMHYGKWLWKGNAPAPWGEYTMYNVRHLPVVREGFEFGRQYNSNTNAWDVVLLHWKQGPYPCSDTDTPTTAQSSPAMPDTLFEAALADQWREFRRRNNLHP